jgi:hypothetical protein
MKDLYHNLGAVPAVVPAVKSATENGTAIDLAGFNSALIVLNTGAIVGDGDFNAKLQESDTTTDADFSDVAAADQLGSFPASLDANAAYRVGYIGSKRKRYIRVVLTKAGGTSIAAGAVAVLGTPAIAPLA